MTFKEYWPGDLRGTTERVTAVGLLLLRLGPATVFLTSGALHLFGGEHDRAVALFMTVRIPFPETAAWFVGGLEFLGGLALLLGVAARPFALMLAAEMGVAIFTVRLPQGIRAVAGYELVLLMTCLAIALLGVGRVSLAPAASREGKGTAAGKDGRRGHAA